MYHRCISIRYMGAQLDSIRRCEHHSRNAYAKLIWRFATPTKQQYRHRRTNLTVTKSKFIHIISLKRIRSLSKLMSPRIRVLFLLEFGRTGAQRT